MATVLEIINGISQVMTNTYDGALDEDGNPIKIGLRREVDNPITDSRVMDGFKVAFHGNKLRIKYHAEVNLKEVHDPKFESNIDQTISDITSFLKKEYKKTTGRTLTLKPVGESETLVQSLSHRRSWCESQQDFQIGGIKSVVPVAEASEDLTRDAIKKWLAIGKKEYPGSAKAQNATRKQPSRPGLGEID